MAQRKDIRPKPAQAAFSRELHKWLRSDGDKSLGALNKVFAEKTFAIAFLLLMALPALPLPTGGVTHVTEIITMLLCLELIAGRKSPWLPKRWLSMDMGKPLSGKAGRRFIAFVEWFERRSRPRWSPVLGSTPALSLTGLVVLAYTLAAFLAPPFSGLDTLPALGVVVMALGMILEDGLMLAAGVLIGAVGIGLELVAGTAIYDSFKHLFKHV